ncbi:hypothetical protein OKW21_004911 [Catalinimonas alkaloidigena]|nr:hypothetical protein [Catalinimonas alkaloidigena]
MMLLASRLLNISLEALPFASVANVGGNATSAPMATTFGLRKSHYSRCADGDFRQCHWHFCRHRDWPAPSLSPLFR